MTETAELNPLRRFFSVIVQPRTYANVAYIWLAFPLGLLYFVLLVTGSALSLGLSLLWIGLFVMAAVVMTIWALAQFERILSEWLLGERLLGTASTPKSQTAWQWLRGVLKNPATWKGGLFLFLKFPIGLACWVFSVVAFSISAAFICAPFDLYEGALDFGYWSIQDPTGGWLIAAAGVLLLFVTLHLHNGMGALWKLMARHLLNMTEKPLTQELQPA